MKVLVTFALDFEFAPWRNLRRFEKISLGQDVVHRAVVETAEIRVAITGVGAANAERVARAICADSPDACISSGLAGALSWKHRVGDVLVAERILLADGSGSVRSDMRLVTLAAESGAVRAGAFVTSLVPVSTAQQKQELSALGDAVEMESHAIFAAANGKGIPAVAVRTVSDTSDENLPLDFSSIFGKTGQVSVPKLLARVASKPNAIPGLIRLGQSSARAAARLAEFLDAYVAALATRWTPAASLREVVAG